MKRWKIGVCIFIMALFLTACGDKTFTADTNTLYIKLDGGIAEASFELFDKEYYDEQELKSFVEQEVRDYNYKNVKEAVAVDRVEVADNVAAAYLNYKTIKDYIAFNESDMFSGTVKQAMDAGYDFETEFVSYDKGEKADILTVTDQVANKILILDDSIDMRFDGTICFVSSNVQKIDKKNVTLTQGGLSYIIYK